jgi:hypothetical protein
MAHPKVDAPEGRFIRERWEEILTNHASVFAGAGSLMAA